MSLYYMPDTELNVLCVIPVHLRLLQHELSPAMERGQGDSTVLSPLWKAIAFQKAVAEHLLQTGWLGVIWAWLFAEPGLDLKGEMGLQG